MFSDVFVVPSHYHCVWIVLVTQNKEIAHTCVQYKSNTPTVKLLIAQVCILLRIIPCNVDMVNTHNFNNVDMVDTHNLNSSNNSVTNIE